MQIISVSDRYFYFIIIIIIIIGHGDFLADPNYLNVFAAMRLEDEFLVDCICLTDHFQMQMRWAEATLYVYAPRGSSRCTCTLLVAPRDAPCTRMDRDAPCTRIDRDAPCTRILWLLDGSSGCPSCSSRAVAAHAAVDAAVAASRSPGTSIAG